MKLHHPFKTQQILPEENMENSHSYEKYRGWDKTNLLLALRLILLGWEQVVESCLMILRVNRFPGVLVSPDSVANGT